MKGATTIESCFVCEWYPYPKTSARETGEQLQSRDEKKGQVSFRKLLWVFDNSTAWQSFKPGDAASARHANGTYEKYLPYCAARRHETLSYIPPWRRYNDDRVPS